MAWFHARGDATPRFDALVAAPAALLLTLAGACVPHTQTRRCAPGETLSDGQCVPTPSVVFARCVDSFRKTAVETDRGKHTKVGVKAPRGYGSAQVERDDAEHERAEYSGVPDALLPEALAECRRQEEQERAAQIARAWAAADAAEGRAREAETRLSATVDALSAQQARAEAAERDLQRTRDAREEDRTRATAELHDAQVTAAEEIASLRTSLAELEAAVEAERAVLAQTHPCTAQVWDRCGAQAAHARADGDLARARTQYAQACEGGDGPSCLGAAQMLAAGQGGPRDAAAAADAFRRACQADVAEACVAEAEQLLAASSGADVVRAAALLESGCADEVPRACGRLGRLIERGDVGSGGRPPVRTLYTDACDGGFGRACVWLGDRRRRGADDRPDAADAADAYADGCDAGAAHGCLRLAELYEAGDGVDEDLEQAAALMDRACRSGVSRACDELARVTARLGALVPKGVPEGIR